MLRFSEYEENLIVNCEYSKRLLEKLKALDKQTPRILDISEIKKAICYAKYYHGTQKRESGEPYYSHPLEVAYMVSDYLVRTDIIVTSILHDTIEDTELTKEMIEEAFGVEISEQVYDLTRVKEGGVKISSGQMVEDLWLQKKYDLLIVKQFDRLHNLKTIAAKSMQKVAKIKDETASIFALLSIYNKNIDIEYQLYNLCSKTFENTEIWTIEQEFFLSSEYNFRLPPLNVESDLIRTKILN